MIHFTRVAKLITVGEGGPIAADGRPARKFISRLSTEDGDRLLREAGLSPDAASDDPLVAAAARWGGDTTDTEVLATVRKEQGQLRQHLLEGRSAAECALCGRLLPRSFLVAAHIVPRSELGEEERRNFASIAMLACTLGCDALFENGLVVVGEDGTVQAGVRTGNTAVQEVVESLTGRKCQAHDHHTSVAFTTHREKVLRW